MNGFTLIESLVYLFCITILLNIFVTVFSTFNLKIKSHVRHSQNSMSAIKGIIFLFDDLKNASNRFKKLSSSEIIYTEDSRDWGWHFLEPNLFRYSGYYDIEKEKWLKKSKSLVMCLIKGLKFVPIYSQGGLLKAFKIKIELLDSQKFDNLVCLRSGIKV